jgi:hypothetical protein
MHLFGVNGGRRLIRIRVGVAAPGARDEQSLVLVSFRDTIGQATERAGANVDRREWRWLAWTGLALVLASNLPYLVAWAATPDNATFTGLVFNPLDGNSYIAKMRQGLEGSWRFHLAYTPEQSRGAYIFLFHLWLGHLARWTEVPLIGIYHGARVLGGAAMLAAIYVLASHLSDDGRERGTIFLLTSLGSGLGWLAGAAGFETADLWVPEAFPPYSLMANAHFPLAIALMAGLAVCGLRTMNTETQAENPGGTAWPWGLGGMLAAVLLGTIQPFGLVPVFGGLGIMLAARALRERAVPWRAGVWIVAAAALALPYPLYMQMAIRSDPVLAAWNAQNATPSPPLWDWALSYGLILVLAVPGCASAIRRGSNADFLLLGWASVTLVGMYLPLPLQRRLSLGLGAPMGLLAGMGWWRTVRRRISARRRSLAQGLVVALGTLTPIFLIAIVSLSALSGETWFYLSAGERAAFAWLRDRGRSDGVVLCAPQTGAFIPAWAGQPVVYGHPFETLNAEQRKARVEAYWMGLMSDVEEREFLNRNEVRYALVGPREQRLSEAKGVAERPVSPIGQSSQLVLDSGTVRVYDLRAEGRRP